MKKTGIVTTILMLLASLTATFALLSLCAYASRRHIDNVMLETAKYSYYLDGEEVDASKIDLHLYRYEVDDNVQAVYITKK